MPITRSIDSVLGKYRQVASTAAIVGGSVISILLATKALARYSVQKPNLVLGRSGKDFPYTPRSVLIVGIPVSARKQENYVFDAETTSHAIEDGSIYSDHVILKPVRIDLEFEVSNYDSDNYLARTSIEQFVSLWETRVPLQLQTEHLILDNMVCLHVEAVNEAPFWGKLAYKASFQQVRMLTVQTLDVPPSQVSGADNAKSSVSSVNTGQTSPQKTIEPNLFYTGVSR